MLSTVLTTFQSISLPPLHATYLPFSIFSILHAVRIACAYRGVTRSGGYDDQIGLVQASIVPVVLVLGGTTITSLLLGNIPGWCITPLGIINYGVFPILAAKSGLVTLLLSLPPLPLNLFFCLVDGFSRTMGITSFGLDSVLNHSNPAIRNNPWSMILIASIAGGGGGMIVPAFRGFAKDWGFGTPSWVKDGPGVDIWGATVVGYVYATLIDAHPFFKLLPSILFYPFQSSFPKGYFNSAIPVPFLPAAEAKMACSLLLAAMLMIRVLNPILQAALVPSPSIKKGKKSTAVATPVPSKSLAKTRSSSNLKEKKSQ